MTDHTAHAQSLAFLTDQAKVTGYEMPSTGDHVSKNPSDLADIAEAQVVTNTKPSFNVDPETAPELQSGPAKKYIDGADPTAAITDAQQQANLAHSTNATMISYTDVDAQRTQSYDDFVPNTDDKDKQSYDALFGAEEHKSVNQNQVTEDIFGDIDRPKTVEIVSDDGDTEDKREDVDDDGNTTFLSVWQEQHREQILKQGKEEREAQDKQVETGKQELERFNEERRKRIELKRKEAQGLESDIRDDYNAVFKHGTIWQQVAKLVDLKTKNVNIDRMKDLLIILKNKDDKGSK